ncbi:hypothetical protein KKF91_18805 [Myxococcota bacterium]|nr:hypothetical protein [Myxococcota bacterium]MBU1432594.1 hypothetical protein [Myxococcota bacterium]MBU1896582.1 hypothetical protein [Myxococcota bacterium]
MSRRRAHLLIALALLGGCRDNPQQVIEGASAAAARGDLVEVQGAFSVSTAQRLERAWDLDHVPKAQGWQGLSQKLVFDGKPLEVKAQHIYEDYAQVIALAGATERDYYLRKEDGRWRIELGAGGRFRKIKARVDMQKAVTEAEAKAEEAAKKARSGE